MNDCQQRKILNSKQCSVFKLNECACTMYALSNQIYVNSISWYRCHFNPGCIKSSFHFSRPRMRERERVYLSIVWNIFSEFERIKNEKILSRTICISTLHEAKKIQKWNVTNLNQIKILCSMLDLKCDHFNVLSELLKYIYVHKRKKSSPI